jgi:hypothetical protein
MEQSPEINSTTILHEPSQPFINAKAFAIKYGAVNSNGDHEFLYYNSFPLQLTQFSEVYGFLYRYDEGDYIVFGKSVKATKDYEAGIFYLYFAQPKSPAYPKGNYYYSYVHTYSGDPIADIKDYTEVEATKIAEEFFVEFKKLLEAEQIFWKGAIK